MNKVLFSILRSRFSNEKDFRVFLQESGLQGRYYLWKQRQGGRDRLPSERTATTPHRPFAKPKKRGWFAETEQEQKEETQEIQEPQKPQGVEHAEHDGISGLYAHMLDALEGGDQPDLDTVLKLRERYIDVLLEN